MSARVVPGRMPTIERALTALKAFSGSHRPPGAHGPIDRMTHTWTWTDHDRRLEWLLTRPRIRRSVFIGVVGHRSDELAEALADTMAASRLERVVLVDCGAAGVISRRLREAGSGFDGIESGLSRTDLSSIERDLLFGRNDQGTLVVPIDPTTAPPDAATMRRLCASLSSHAGIVVFDCGALAAPNATAVECCDQVVASTTGAIRDFDAQLIAAIWGDGELPPDGSLHASHRVSDDPTSVTELAVVIAAGWADIGAATPVPGR